MLNHRYYIHFVKTRLDAITFTSRRNDKIRLNNVIFDKLSDPDGIKFINHHSKFKHVVHKKLIEFAFLEKREIEFHKNVKKWFKAIFGINFILDYITLSTVHTDFSIRTNHYLIHNRLIQHYYESYEDRTKIANYFQYIYGGNIEKALLKKP